MTTQRSKIALFLLFFGLASLCHAETAMVPSWLPADQRFEVEGTSNEIAQIDHTLALMRDALHPKLKAQMKSEDLGPTLNWIVHVSLPCVTNENAYFDSYKTPIPSLFFEKSTSFALLTNRASRLSYLPSIPKLFFVYDDGTRNSLSRPLPGVDYPGIFPEDTGSTPLCLRIALCAPKSGRRIKVMARMEGVIRQNCEFKWIESWASCWTPMPICSRKEPEDTRTIWADTRNITRSCKKVVFVFARVAGGIWGPPSRLVIGPDPFGKRKYGRAALLESIDYGNFMDVYRYDERDELLGFTRILPGIVRGDEYFNAAEKIVDGYADDRPKTTRKVYYYLDNGKICYRESEENIHRRNERRENRLEKW